MAVYTVQKKNEQGAAEDIEIAIPSADRTQLDTATQDIKDLQGKPILQLTQEQINAILGLVDKLTITSDGRIKSKVEIEAPSFNDVP